MSCAVLLRVGHLELEAVADELAGVADLAAAFAVERRAIEHDAHRVLRGRLSSILSHS